MLGLEVFVCRGDWENERRSEVRMSEGKSARVTQLGKRVEGIK